MQSSLRVPPHGASVFVVWQSEAFPATMIHCPLTGSFKVHFGQQHLMIPNPGFDQNKLICNPGPNISNMAAVASTGIVPTVSQIHQALYAQAGGVFRPVAAGSPAAVPSSPSLMASSTFSSSVVPSSSTSSSTSTPASSSPSSVSSMPSIDSTVSTYIAGGIALGSDGMPCGSKATHRPMRNGQMKRMCKMPACQSFVTKYGLCKKHGGMDKCILQGCNTNTEARGLCRKHGATGFCSSPGCSLYAHARGRCRKHSDKGMCAVAECQSFAQAQGLCRKHGGRATCSMTDCFLFTHARGLCKTHGEPPACTAAGCGAPSEGRGLCRTHLLSGYALLNAASALSGTTMPTQEDIQLGRV